MLTYAVWGSGREMFIRLRFRSGSKKFANTAVHYERAPKQPAATQPRERCISKADAPYATGSCCPDSLFQAEIKVLEGLLHAKPWLWTLI